MAAIVLSSPDAVIAKTVDGIVTSWNDGATLVYGHTAEQMIGRSIELMIPPSCLAAERTRHRRVAQGLAESGYRCVRLCADGRPIQVVMSMSPVRNDADEVVGVASISRPVSDKETADVRFAALLEAAPDAIVVVDGSGRIAKVNARVAEVFGYAPEELVHAPLGTLIPDDQRDHHAKLSERFFRNPIPRALGAGAALYGRRRDGSCFPIEVSLSVDTSTGETLTIAAVRDVTAARATEAALRERETQLRQLAENSDLIFTLRQIEPPLHLYVGPGASKLTGSAEQDVRDGTPLLEKFLHPDDRARVESVFRGTTHGQLPASAEYRIIRVDGEVRWVRSSATAVPNPHGPPERIVTTTQDITERVAAREALQEAEGRARAANHAKNEFLSRMSHELRTPLSAILGFGQLLEAQLENPEQAESARHVVRAGRHLLNLIDEVLDISKIEAGEMTLSLEALTVANIIDESVVLMQPLANAARVTLTVDPGPDDTFVYADRQRIRQVMLNLISNAIKYNVAGGTVWISWTSGRGHRGPSITVTDDGPGIPPELHSRLFIPFDRLGAEATKVEGTGVGLTVTRNLTELMHGQLAVASTVGTGSTFTVTLPPSEAPVTRPASVPRVCVPHRPEAGEVATLLHIEDHEPNVRVMESLLKLRPEWRFIHAGHVSLGLELAEAHRPDLILTDVHLPDGSGLDVLTGLKDRAATAGIPVVVLSADANEQQAQRLLTAGAMKYMTKPLDLAEVLALLDSRVAAKKAERPQQANPLGDD